MQCVFVSFFLVVSLGLCAQPESEKLENPYSASVNLELPMGAIHLEEAKTSSKQQILASRANVPIRSGGLIEDLNEKEMKKSYRRTRYLKAEQDSKKSYELEKALYSLFQFINEFNKN